MTFEYNTHGFLRYEFQHGSSSLLLLILYLDVLLLFLRELLKN